jgi:hypothetical protein
MDAWEVPDGLPTERVSCCCNGGYTVLPELGDHFVDEGACPIPAMPPEPLLFIKPVPLKMRMSG